MAVSANIVPLAFGTETDTSIINPAGINGVVGIKPTVGLTSRSGVIPISKILDAVGPLGRSVADAVHGLNVIAGADGRDSFSISAVRCRDEDYRHFLSSKAVLKRAKFGLPWKGCWEFVPCDLKQVCQKVFDAIEKHGGEVLCTDFPCADDRIARNGRWDW